MPVDILLGLQWGDEGKGKIVDVLAPNYSVIARFQGGPNAGHTLVINGRKHVLHQIPSGIFHEHLLNVVGNGVVLDPIVLKSEIEQLEQIGVDTTSRLVFSDKAHLITPGHRMLDEAYESAKGKQKIGSTLKGIGPCYQDKYARNGLRLGLVNQANFKGVYSNFADRQKNLLERYDANYSERLDKDSEAFLEACEYISKHRIINTEVLINDKLSEGANILAEGAQGSLLDIEFGTYPFVTSSHTVSAGACIGLGVAPKHIRKTIGIFKAYCTRVGSGPFPTELHDEVGEQLRTSGNEFGSTTGRPRRCGWLDLKALDYANMLNGTDELMMMKADVLDGMEEIKIATGYGKNEEPLYDSLPGWRGGSGQATSFEDLPKELKNYIKRIEEHCMLPIRLVSVGPDRSQTIFQ